MSPSRLLNGRTNQPMEGYGDSAFHMFHILYCIMAMEFNNGGWIILTSTNVHQLLIHTTSETNSTI